MTTAISRHEVKDYDAWKRRFDAAAEDRTAHGFLGAKIYRDVKQPSVVFVFFDWDTPENARTYLESLQLKAKMMDAGVVGIPQFNILRPAD